MYAHECIIVTIIIYCRVAPEKSIEFKNKLGFSHNILTRTKEQSVIIRISKSFPDIKIIQQYFVLHNKYKIDSYLPDYKLATKIDGKGHTDRKEEEEKEKEKEIKEELDCKFIRINLESENFDMDAIIGTIFNHINKANKKLVEESTKKSIMDDVTKSLETASKFSNNPTISDFTKQFIKHTLPTI